MRLNLRLTLPIRRTGHRLKSADSKTTKMFDVLDVPRRIILSGTPVQNNLGEFHAMVSPVLSHSTRPHIRVLDQFL